jgi:hypothetical protein
MKTITTLPKVMLGLGLLMAAGFLASCSVTTSPDDSTLAPKVGTSLIFEEYAIDLRDRSRDATKKPIERVHTILGTGLTFAGETNVLMAFRQNADTVRLKHKLNGDLLMYQPEISVGLFDVPGHWVRLAYGLKIADTMTVMDSARVLGGSRDSLRITIAQSFEGPTTVLVEGKPINVLQLRVIRQQYRSSGPIAIRDTEDAIYWYAPSLGYIIQENIVFTQQVGTNTPSSTGIGHTLIRVES